ncbi:MAG: hypothetical protein HY276_04715 [Ignavibacteriales bacterium]|nr:hypothetical protein [Ignavibacteriales bacterium]MBI3787542.1 hypothetical protein [Ignavibacteriales bacterium]
MGSSTIMDIIGSTIVAGILFLMALRLNSQAIETTIIYNDNVNLQQNMTTLVNWVETDFRRIGYCKDYTKVTVLTKAIRRADSSDITFWADMNPDVNTWSDVHESDALDSVRWYIGPTSEMADTPNPRDRKIYRVVNNGTPVGWNLGVTQFQLKYFDYMGNALPTPVPNPQLIYSLQISIAVESPSPITLQYTAKNSADTVGSAFKVFWRQLRLAARNLKNR